MKEQYGYEIFSTGAIQREYARNMGISTLELNLRMKENPQLDKEIDDTVTKIRFTYGMAFCKKYI